MTTYSQSIESYDLGQCVGRGGFASVYRAVYRNNREEVAIKVSVKARIRQMEMEDRVENELRIHSTLPKHANIVKVLTYFEDEDNTYMVMELCVHGNLYRELRTKRSFNEMQAKRILKQLLSAVAHLHEEGIVHRDLKLSNVLIADGDRDNNGNLKDIAIKLCDFGLAACIAHPDEEHYTLCGTPNYIAPEIASNHAHGYPADLWSLGCLFYTLVVGRPPFEPSQAQKERDGRQHQQQMKRQAEQERDCENDDDDGNNNENSRSRQKGNPRQSPLTRRTFDNILIGRYEVPPHVHLSEQGRRLLATLLHQEPSRRESARVLLFGDYFDDCDGSQSADDDDEEEEEKDVEHEQRQEELCPSSDPEYIATHKGRHAPTRVALAEVQRDVKVQEGIAVRPIGEAISRGSSMDKALLPPRPSEEPSLESAPSYTRAAKKRQEDEARVKKLLRRQKAMDGGMDSPSRSAGSGQSKSSSEEGVAISQRRTCDLSRRRRAPGPERDAGQEVEGGDLPVPVPVPVVPLTRTSVSVSRSWLGDLQGLRSSLAPATMHHAVRESHTARASFVSNASDAENLPPPSTPPHAQSPESTLRQTQRRPLGEVQMPYRARGQETLPGEEDHSYASSLTHSTMSLGGASLALRSSIERQKMESTDHRLAMWTGVADRLGPFSICTPDGELLLLSKEKTLLFCVPTHKRSGGVTFARLVARRSRPLELLVARAEGAMEKEIIRIMDSTVRRAKGQVDTADRSSRSRGGDAGSEDVDARKLRISYDDGSGTGSASVFGNIYSDSDCRCLSQGLTTSASASAPESGLVASHAIHSLPGAVDNAFRKAVRLMGSILSRAPREIVYLTRAAVLDMAGTGTGTGTGEKEKEKEKEKESMLSAATTASARSIGESTARSPSPSPSPRPRGLHQSQSQSQTDDSKIVCKSMLMSNTPLPDFCMQWQEGTCVRYRLSDGVMRVDVPRGEPSPATSLSCRFAPESVSPQRGEQEQEQEQEWNEDIRNLSGVTDGEEEEGCDEERLPPLRWEGPLDSSVTGAGVPTRVLGYLLSAQAALKVLMDGGHSLCASASAAAASESRSKGAAGEPRVRII